MRGGFYYLGDYVIRILNAFSDRYPNKVVKPSMISCFVLQEKDGRKYYYPVQGVSKIKRPKGNSGYFSTWASFNIDTYSFCQDPKDVKSSITAADILDFESNEGKIDYYNWFCPQLDKDVCIVSDDKSQSELCSLLGEGIMILSVC